MLSKSYGLGDMSRQQYLETYVFPNFVNDSYLRNANLTELQIENKNKVFDILRKWSRGEIEFTKQFMTRYSPRTKSGKLPFKNIGNTPRLESMHSKDSSSRKYYGLSHGRTYREFLVDVANPSSIPIDYFSKPSITSDQIATWSYDKGEWIITYVAGKSPPQITKNINLYRKQYDSFPSKQMYYWTATHINQPFRLSDIEEFENNPIYLVEYSPKTPFVAVGGRFYIVDEPKVIYKNDKQEDSLLNTVVSSNDSVVLDDIPFSDSNTGGLDQSIPPSFSLGLSSDVPDVTTNTGVEVNPNVPIGVEYSGVNNEGGNTGGFYGFGSNGGSETPKISDNTVNAGIITGLGSAGIILIGAALLYFGRKK